MNQYNKLTEMCFNDCATDFTTRNILTSEVMIGLTFTQLRVANET